jgi:hypothetical protein
MRELIYEQGVLLKLYYNKTLQDRYLPDIMPIIFTKNRKIMALTMKYLHSTKTEINLENMLLAQKTPEIMTACRKYKQKYLDRDTLIDFFELDAFTPKISHSPDLFEEAFEQLHDETFFEFVEKFGEDFKYDTAYKNKHSILSRAKAIQKIYDVLYKSKVKNRKDGIRQAVAFLRSKKNYIPTFSTAMNSSVGGFSRGFAATLMGKPSHGKSTLMTYLSIYLIKKNLVDKVSVLSAEEPEEIFWRRVFSAYYKIPMDLLRSGEYDLSEKQVLEVERVFKNRINFYAVNTLGAAADTLFTLEDSELIWLDHVNALKYPRDDMNSGIFALVSREKEFLAKHKDNCVVNLSQVNTKRMLSAGRLVATKEDAFGSSYLEQAAREMLTVYYPYADATDEGLHNLWKDSKYKKWDIEHIRDTVELHVQKNSFGDKPVLRLKYHQTMGRFEDSTGTVKGINVILPEPEAKPEPSRTMEMNFGDM